MSKQEDVTDPAKGLFADDQNDAHDTLIASGTGSIPRLSTTWTELLT
jgi:hypothetical protein